MTDPSNLSDAEIEAAVAPLVDEDFESLDLGALSQLDRYADPPRVVSKDFFQRAVAATWMAHTTGKGATAPAAHAEDPALPLEKLQQLFSTPAFLKALRNRGIPATDLNYLTPEMVATLQVLADPSLSLMPRQRLDRLGVPWSQYQGWLHYAPFRDAHQKVMRHTLAVATEVGDRVLASRIEAGDLNAIKYANEMTGKFVPGNQQQASVSTILSMVLSVLQRNITDPEVLARTSAELLSVATGHGIPEPVPLVLEATVMEPNEHNEHPEPRAGTGGPRN